MLLLVVASAIGLGVNAARGSKGRINLGRDYFPKAVVVPDSHTTISQNTQSDKNPANSKPFATPLAINDALTDASTANAPLDAKASPNNVSASKRIEHEFQDASFEFVQEVFEDPNTEFGINIFLDARNDDSYAEGHIPGAFQCDHYRLEDYILPVLSAAETAEKIVVYCNGGDCEDSVLLCRELVAAGVAYEKLYLFAGGIEEWEKNEMPLTEGSKR